MESRRRRRNAISSSWIYLKKIFTSKSCATSLDADGDGGGGDDEGDDVFRHILYALCGLRLSALNDGCVGFSTENSDCDSPGVRYLRLSSVLSSSKRYIFVSGVRRNISETAYSRTTSSSETRGFGAH